MRTRQKVAHQVQTLLVVVLFAAECVLSTRAQGPVSTKEQSEVTAGFKVFLDRVGTYATLHKSIESTLPAVKSTDLPEMITAHQLALARKIREARPSAKRGEIFTEHATRAFRITIREEFQGPQGRNARTTIRQGAPLTKLHLQVNEPYPDGVPFTTVPPTLLLRLPKLPDQVAYRIVGRDLILLDVAANLVVDEIPEVIP
jgi:hypothetical protein